MRNDINNHENPIKIIAGRPGSGKTRWMIDEILNLLNDPNNAVIFIGFEREYASISSKLAENQARNFLFADEDHASEFIGKAIDLTYAISQYKYITGQDAEEKRVYLFYDQCRHAMYPGRRDLLLAASKAGVDISIICQMYNQVDKGDTVWLVKNCDAYVISKGKAPRLANKDEFLYLYRD